MPLTHPQLARVLMLLRPGINPLFGFRVEDHGSGPFLVDGSMVNPPTQAQVDAVTIAQLDAFDVDYQADVEIGRISEGMGIVLKMLFNHENRIRTLAGQPQVTVAQFKAFLKSLAT
jgi:hypothetical protein